MGKKPSPLTPICSQLPSNTAVWQILWELLAAYESTEADTPSAPKEC